MKDTFMFHMLRVLLVAILVIGPAFMPWGMWSHFGTGAVCLVLALIVQKAFQVRGGQSVLEAGVVDRIIYGPNPWAHLVYYSLTLAAGVDAAIGALRYVLRLFNS